MDETNLFIKVEQYDEIIKTIQKIKTRTSEVKIKIDDLNKIDDVEKRKIKECEELLKRIDAFTEKTEELLKKR